MNFKKLNEELKQYLESSLPDISKMDKICDLDKHYIESGRYIGRRNGKWNIYKYARTSQKFNGDWNYDYKATSPDFDTYDEAIEWFANDLLKYNSEEDLYDCIKEGSFVIYDDKLNAQLGTTGIKAGKLDTSLRFPTGTNKGIDPVPQYMLEPNKAKANNLRRDYIKTHGKPYESVTESVNRILQEEQSYQLYVENLTQPIEVIGNINKYGVGECQYKGGLELGDTIAVRMLGTINTDVYNFKITEINEDNLIAVHPRTGTEYNISLSKPVEVSYATELRFKSVKDDDSWFAFLDLDRKTKTELLTNKTGDLS